MLAKEGGGSDTLPSFCAARAAAAIIRAGGLVAIPTETVYGIGGDASSDAACRKIYAVKNRATDNPLIVHVHNVRALYRYTREQPKYLPRLLRAFTPGPLTVVLKKSPDISAVATCGLDTVAIRIPGHRVARRIISVANRPVAAPSANLSGALSGTTATMVYATLCGKVDAVVNGGKCRIGMESTIVLVESAQVTVLRPGVITAEMIARVLGMEVAVCVLDSEDSTRVVHIAPTVAPNAEHISRADNAHDYSWRADNVHNSDNGTRHMAAPDSVAHHINNAPSDDAATIVVPGRRYAHYCPRSPLTLFVPPVLAEGRAGGLSRISVLHRMRRTIGRVRAASQTYGSTRASYMAKHSAAGDIPTYAQERCVRYEDIAAHIRNMLSGRMEHMSMSHTAAHAQTHDTDAHDTQPEAHETAAAHAQTHGADATYTKPHDADGADAHDTQPEAHTAAHAQQEHNTNTVHAQTHNTNTVHAQTHNTDATYTKPHNTNTAHAHNTNTAPAHNTQPEAHTAAHAQQEHNTNTAHAQQEHNTQPEAHDTAAHAHNTAAHAHNTAAHAHAQQEHNTQPEAQIAAHAHAQQEHNTQPEAQTAAHAQQEHNTQPKAQIAAHAHARTIVHTTTVHASTRYNMLSYAVGIIAYHTDIPMLLKNIDNGVPDTMRYQKIIRIDGGAYRITTPPTGTQHMPAHSDMPSHACTCYYYALKSSKEYARVFYSLCYFFDTIPVDAIMCTLPAKESTYFHSIYDRVRRAALG